MKKAMITLSVCVFIFVILLCSSCQGVQGIKGEKGDSGISIIWLGSYSIAPSSRNLNNAYYNSTDGISYIWDGDSWEILAKDGQDGAKGAQGFQGEEGASLIVAMGYVYEDFANQPLGHPRLISGYNVEDVDWVSDCYVVTLSGIAFGEYDYLVSVISVGFVFTSSWNVRSEEGKLCISCHSFPINAGSPEEFFYIIGSFQFIVYKYPD